MRRLILCAVCLVSLIASVNVGRAQNISPTFDFLLVFDNVGYTVEAPNPSTLIVASRSGLVSLSTAVGSSGIVSTVNVDQNTQTATSRLTVTLLSLTSFTVKGVVTVNDAQRSTIEFETVDPGIFEAEASIINGIPYLRGAYVAKVTKGTGQFANRVGLVVSSLVLDVSRPGLQNAISSEFILFRLAPANP